MTAARRDTSRATRMLARRPAPSDTRVVRLAEPLVPGARYIIWSDGVVGLTGVVGRGRTSFTVPRPPPPKPAADSLHPRTQVDTAGVRPAGAPGAADSARAPARADTLRSDTTRERRDTVPERPKCE